ncbi:MAG: TolC family protein [Verrucomicrobia bacterium]|nr:TolC family protein [Cytophagales bacterium]
MKKIFNLKQTSVKVYVALLSVCWFVTSVQAQTGYTLQQAVDYAVKNNVSVKNASLDVTNAKYRINEVKSVGLPQINGTVQLQHNIKIQQSILDGRAGSNPFLNSGGASEPGFYEKDIYTRLNVNDIPTPAPAQPADPNAVFSFAFGLKNNAILSVTASQLLFSSSYLVGLQAARVYREVTQKSLTNSKINITELVSKAYYGVLVNQERLDLLKANVERLEKLLNETREFNKNGFVEKLDVDRLEVQFNNLKVEAEKVARLVDLSYDLLKFQMGMNISEKITLADKLGDLSNATFTPIKTDSINYTNRIEYSLLESQKSLNILDVKNLRSGRIPSLGMSATYGYNPAATRLQDIFESSRWLNFFYVGFQLNVPIFDGLGTYNKVQQKKIELLKTENSMSQFRQTIDLQISQANITLENALESLKTQKRNLDLAEEIIRVTRIKYQQGVGSNIEVINAEASLKEAQTNYFGSLYDALVAKVDLDKSSGALGSNNVK